MCVLGEEGKESEANMQNNQSVQSLPSLAWQRRAARTTSNCIQEHWGIVLSPILSGNSRWSSPSHPPGRSPCLPHSSSHTGLSKSMTFHVLPHWCNSPALPYLELPNNATLPPLPCLWQLKPGGIPLLGEVMVGGRPGLSEQRTWEDGTGMICPKFSF